MTVSPVVGLCVASLVLLLIGWATRGMSLRPGGRLLDLSNPDVLLPTWIEHAAAFTPTKDVHEHIIKHSGELTTEIEGNGTYETWSASMHNLLAIFDAAHGIQPDADLRLERMTAKYLSDLSTAPPPAPVPERIVLAARGPLIEQRRRMAREAEEEKRRRSYY